MVQLPRINSNNIHKIIKYNLFGAIFKLIPIKSKVICGDAPKRNADHKQYKYMTRVVLFRSS